MARDDAIFPRCGVSFRMYEKITEKMPDFGIIFSFDGQPVIHEGTWITLKGLSSKANRRLAFFVAICAAANEQTRMCNEFLCHPYNSVTSVAIRDNYFGVLKIWGRNRYQRYVPLAREFRPFRFNPAW